MNGFRTENEELARRAGAFAAISDRARDIVDQLNDSLDGHGQCWGDDVVGQSFAETHVEPARAALQGIGALPSGLLDIGTQFSDTAATYDDAEQTSTDTVHGAGRPLE